MKTIQIKVSIDGVNYLSEPYEAKKQEVLEHAEDSMIDGLPYGVQLEKGNYILFGSELVKKSIITIIEL